MTLDEIVQWFESLSPAGARDVPRYYAENAYFRDPFNEVHTAAEIARVYSHMFVQVDAPRFVVTRRWHGDDGVILAWDFHYRMRGTGRQEKVEGVSHLRFGADGRITHHRDYWDAAGELYERIPVLGGFMRFLRGRLRAP